MGWATGFDSKWNRDIGYGVPATCDHPGCGKEIDRGLSYVCGGAPYGGDRGCGLFFCNPHGGGLLCERCAAPQDIGERKPFEPTPDRPEWLAWKLRDASWKAWRDEHPEDVERLRELLCLAPKPSADYAAGFRAARNAASKIIVDYTDGDSPFDGTIARMAEQIDRLMPAPDV